MEESSSQPAPRQVRWSDTTAGILAIPHLLLGAFLIINLFLHDYEKGMLFGLPLATATTVFGILVIFFVAQATAGTSRQRSRRSFVLAIVYLCFSIVIMGISWTYLVGWAIVSVVYFAESVVLVVTAWQTIRESRKYPRDPTR